MDALFARKAERPSHERKISGASRRLRLYGWICCLGTLLPLLAIARQANVPFVSVHVKNATLNQLIAHLQQQVDFEFIYTYAKEHTKGKITINMDHAPLTTVLDKALTGTRLEYIVRGKVIIIREPLPPESPPADTSRQQIAGFVRDENNQPIPLASIWCSDGQRTYTDRNGYFSLLTNITNRLKFSCIGFHQLTLPADDKKVNDVHLRKLSEQMKEVVVNGYQQQQNWEITGAVSKLRCTAASEGYYRLDQSLQGQLPGLSVGITSGAVGANPTSRIRGATTLVGSREPVWVVDGVVREDWEFYEPGFDKGAVQTSEMIALQARQSVIGNSILGLNPDDIASVTILKDAAATSIYGARAANGVIVVTTKKGKIGPPTISIRTEMSVSDKPSYRTMDRMNSAERVALSKEVLKDGTIYPDRRVPQVAYDGLWQRWANKEIDQDQYNREMEILERNNTDWFNILFRNSISKNTYLNISGGSKRATYYASIGYMDEAGSAKGNDMKRISSLLKSTFRVTNAIELGIQLNTSFRNIKGFYDGLNPYEYAYNTNRAIRPEDFYEASLGDQYRPADFSANTPLLHFNFLNELQHTGNTSKNDDINLAAWLKIRLGKHLLWESLFAPRFVNTYNRRWADERSYTAALQRGTDFDPANAGMKDIVNTDTLQMRSYVVRSTLQFSRPVGNTLQHTISALAGAEVRSTAYRGIIGGKPQDPFTGVRLFAGPEPEELLSAQTFKQYNFLSVFGNASYAYRQKYIVSFNARTDASNRIAASSPDRFNPVWSAGVRWNIKEENWLSKSKIIDQLAIRASWGYQGNTVPAIAPVLWLTNTTDSYTPGSIRIGGLPYQDLRWERTRALNLGIEMELLNGRIGFTFDYYNKRTKDALLKQPVPVEFGVAEAYINGAEIRNNGYEYAVFAKPISTKDWTWNIQWVFNYNRNEVYHVRENASLKALLSGSGIVNGKPVGGIWSFRYAGLSAKDGQPNFYGLDVNPKEELLREGRPQDYLLYQGASEPTVTGGLTTNVRYKRWSLAASFSYQGGSYVRLNPLAQGGDGGYWRLPTPDRNVSKELNTRWKQPGDETLTNIPAVTSFRILPPWYSIAPSFGDVSMLDKDGNLYRYTLYNYSDLRTVSAANLRCNNISLRCNLDDIIKKWTQHVSQTTITAGVNNAFLLANKQLKGQDPELGYMSATENTAILPRYRSYYFSVMLGF